MVDAKIEDLSQTRKKITIKVPQGEVDNYLKKAYQKVGGQANIKGFRPGKAPPNMLDRHYGPEIERECLTFLVDDTYPQAIFSHSIIPISRPDFDVTPIMRSSDYHYSVVVEIKPEFELKEYNGVPLNEVKVTVSPEEIAKELEEVRENLAQVEPAVADEVVRDGLVALMDFEGRIAGEPFEGGSAKDYWLTCGKGHFLKEFEYQMVGMKPGETREVGVTFQADYFQKNLAGKKADFTVTVKSVHHKKLPTLDDELAKDVGKKDLAELKSELEKIVLEGKKSGVRREYAEQIRKLIISSYDFEVPEALISEESRRSGKDRKEIIDQIRYEFVLEAVAEKEELSPQQEDVDRRLAVYSQIYRRPLAEIKKTFLTNRMLPHLMSGILIDKALDFVIDHAKMI